MEVEGRVEYYTGPNAGDELGYTSGIIYDTDYCFNLIDVGGTSGRSLFRYLVDEVVEHTSTDWWEFDFD